MTFIVSYVEAVTSTVKMEAVGMLEMSEATPYNTQCYNQKDLSVYNKDHHENLSGSYTFLSWRSCDWMSKCLGCHTGGPL